MTYSEDNIEDWDFRHTRHDDPEYDNDADLFFLAHFTTAVAVDAIRLQVLLAFIDQGVATLDEDKEYIRFASGGDSYLAGWKRATSRWSRDARFERKVVESLRRENRKYGKLKLRIVPPRQGPRGGEGSDTGSQEAIIEAYRPSVQALDPHVYENVLSIAFAPDATPAGNALARSDPDAFVAFYLAECERSGVSVQEISDHFDEVRAFAEEHAVEIERMRRERE